MKKAITAAVFIAALSAPAFAQVVEGQTVGAIGVGVAGTIPFVLVLGLVGLAASASD